MSTFTQFHRVRSVSVQETFKLHVVFTDGAEKEYDLEQLEDRPEFALLFRHPGFVKSVHVDPGGYGVSWNDQIDIGSEELWFNGK